MIQISKAYLEAMKALQQKVNSLKSESLLSKQYLQMELSQSSGTIDCLKNQINNERNTHEDHIRRLEGCLSACQRELAQSRLALQNSRASFQQEKDRIARVHQEELSQIKKVLEGNLQDAVMDGQRGKKQFEFACKEKEALFKEMQGSLKAAQQEVCELKQRVIQKDLALGEIKQSLFRANYQISNLKNVTAESDTLLRSKDRNFEQLKSRASVQKEQKNKLEQNYRQLLKNVEFMKQRHYNQAKTQELEKEENKACLDRLTEQKTALEQASSSQATKIKALEKEMSGLRQDVQSRDSKLKGMEEKHSKRESQLLDEKKSLDELMAKKEKELKATRERLNEAQAHLHRLADDNTKRKMTFISLLQKNDEFIKKMNQKEDESASGSAFKELKENVNPQVYK